MKLPGLREFTTARVSLGRTGDSLPLDEVQKLQLAHARAREAVHSTLDLQTLTTELGQAIRVTTAATDRQTYLRRPDLGRRLHDDSRQALAAEASCHDVAFIVADGLSALAVNRHAVPLMNQLNRFLSRDEWSVAPIVLVEQGRVAIGDEIGASLGAALAVVLIGERPGLSCHDSLGVYLTWNPHPGLTDADRNCISNIHDHGLSYEAASHTLLFLMNESRRRKLSGVLLKEDAKALEG